MNFGTGYQFQAGAFGGANLLLASLGSSIIGHSGQSSRLLDLVPVHYIINNNLAFYFLLTVALCS